MKSQHEKAVEFRALHEQDDAFIIPNPWDRGSAKLLERVGFEALATSSAGYAFSLGRPDLSLDRDLVIAHAADIVAATNLPVSADLENGFGGSPEEVAETIRLAAATGLVGGSIEDGTNKPDAPVYDFELAVERVRAAVEAARALPFPFTLTARSENFLVGRPDLNDTIMRLQDYQAAGADVLYAPGLRTLEDIATVVREVDRPVNVLMVAGLSVAQLSDIGVKRVSTGSGLSRAALGAFLRAASELHNIGTFDWIEEAADFGELNSWFAE